MKKVFNWSEVHSERSDFLQNPYFSDLSFIQIENYRKQEPTMQQLKLLRYIFCLTKDVKNETKTKISKKIKYFIQQKVCRF